MADPEEKLKRKRSTIRAFTTRILHKIENSLTEPEVDIDGLEELLGQLTAKETILVRLDEDIENKIVDVDDLESEVEGSQDYQERIITWKGRAMRKLQRMQSGCVVPHEVNRSIAEETQNNGSTRSTIKLPPLTLEKFYGDPITWQGFWSQYEVAIHENASLSKADKFNYLRSYLGGSAANAIRGLAMTNENYDSAISLLSERFGRKDLVINAHMNKLLNLEPVKKSSDVENMRRLYDSCEIQVRSLASMGVVTETYGSLLCPILLKIIPEDIALNFSRHRDSDNDWNVQDLLKFIQKEVESRERTSILTSPGAEKQNPQYEHNKSNPKSTPWQPRPQSYPKMNLPSTSALFKDIQFRIMLTHIVQMINVGVIYIIFLAL